MVLEIFIHDRKFSDCSLKWFSVVDELIRECVALEVRRSVREFELVGVLEDLVKLCGGNGLQPWRQQAGVHRVDNAGVAVGDGSECVVRGDGCRAGQLVEDRLHGVVPESVRCVFLRSQWRRGYNQERGGFS